MNVTDLSAKLREAFDTASYAMASQMLSLMKIRIQNQGKDTSGKDLRQYSNMWASIRQQEGRQTSRRDLTFTGDMMNSLQVGTSEGDIVIGFDSAEQYHKAGENELIAGTRIFEFNEDELDDGKEVFRNVYSQIMQQ